ATAPASQPAVHYNLERAGDDGWAKMPEEWFRSAEAGTFAQNILAWQLPTGGWPKRPRMHLEGPDPTTAPAKRGSFDNGNTMSQMRFLGNRVRVTGDGRCREAFVKGLDFMLAAQMPCGGWPQEFPEPHSYHALITYNDGAMIGVMSVLRDVTAGKYPFVDAAHVERCGQAVDRGIECILKTQVTVNGQLTIWGQQHDPQTLAPAKARAFELPLLVSAESSVIVRFLMDLDSPSPQVRQAVHAAVAWMKHNALTGLRYEMWQQDSAVVADPSAEPLWARFYDQATGKPVFVGRDGVPKADLREIEQERRADYLWYGRWPARVIDRYEAWCAEHGEKPVD
ncbi:MAG: pectate lyase, partial [Phycisphaerae bacterium]|nr:pectate lyase [Phycisphaerae bacterium]